ncbi:hypothetical protein BDFG_09374 [Blastomyces dermatitidis ATCC 26199]|nr:hypothetical protein BDFG_09374 [Blastomyces dermatitidis ATCC 26199]
MSCEETRQLEPNPRKERRWLLHVQVLGTSFLLAGLLLATTGEEEDFAPNCSTLPGPCLALIGLDWPHLQPVTIPNLGQLGQLGQLGENLG